jgi:hypothetical protein
MKPPYRLPDDLPWWHEAIRTVLFLIILAVLVVAFMGIGR